MLRKSSFATAFLALGVALVGCTPRPRMCVATVDCTDGAACVAGRCQADKPNVKPAVDASRRFVFRPVDLAYVRRGDRPSDGALPPTFALGKEDALLLLRFEVALSPSANIVEAYVVLHRSDAVDDDPAPISLHATRIVQAWEGRSTSFALQPRRAATRTPTTLVSPGGAALVRVDVRDLVRQWPKHDPLDRGIAIAGEGDSRTGTTFAFRSGGADDGSGSDLQLGASVGRSGERSSSSYFGEVEPYLEIYLR